MVRKSQRLIQKKVEIPTQKTKSNKANTAKRTRNSSETLQRTISISEDTMVEDINTVHTDFDSNSEVRNALDFFQSNDFNCFCADDLIECFNLLGNHQIALIYNSIQDQDHRIRYLKAQVSRLNHKNTILENQTSYFDAILKKLNEVATEIWLVRAKCEKIQHQVKLMQKCEDSILSERLD
jgi:TolA-binding protein